VPLSAGTRLGPYEISSALGAGGMGEVYKATDTRLDRTVALKVLPEHVASDPDLKQRFEREAKTLAALSHPHICNIHDVGSQNRIDFLVMEYLEGETLEQRLKKGALPFDQALHVGIQITDALAAAHHAGIVHRDLKPANIMLTKSGAKLLDFGLAKIGARAVAGSLSMLPTTPPNLTQHGSILGTFQYMAPEQLEGNQADARTDIFAFGAVLYEMVTGRKAFEGKSHASLIAAILEREPPAMCSLQPLTPPLLDRVVKKCLAKQPEHRWQSARDLFDELKWIAETRTVGTPAAKPPPAMSPRARWRRLVAPAAVAAFAAVMLAGTAAWMALRNAAPQGRVLRLTIAPTGPATPSVGGNDRDLAITPDGTRVVYVGNNGTQLFVRPLDQLDATVLTTGAPRGIFVSPNGQWVGFSDGTAVLKKIAITGGPAITIGRVDGTGPRGATWLPDDTIVFATSGANGLQRISANGGDATVLTRPKREQGEIGHVFPEALPDGRTVLFTITVAGSTDQAQIVAFDLATGTQKVILRGGSHAHYLSSGHLVYAVGGSLRVVGFDATQLETRGTQVPVVPRLVTAYTGVADFDVADDGTLAYLDGPGGALPGNRVLVWVDRQGREQPITLAPHAWTYPRISPDGTRVAVSSVDQEADIWIADLARETLTPFTFDPAQDSYPLWTPDGRRIIFMSQRDGGQDIYWQAADGVGSVEQLRKDNNAQQPTGISPDAMNLVFNESGPGGIDLMLLGLAEESQGRPLVQTPFTDRNGVISPDGRWLAYESDSSGRFEIYARPFSDTSGGQRQVSTGGGTRAVWAHSGRELFYMALDGALMRVPIDAKGSVWSAGTPQKLLEPKYHGMGSNPGRTFDVSPDDQRFLMIKQGSSDQVAPPQIVVVQHWFEELKRLVPTQ
jgi:serine/threonine-protein kinase